MPERVSPSLIISVLALIVALGGVSYAAIKIPKNSVGTKQLKRNAVSTAKLKRGAVNAAKLRRDSINSAKVRNGSLLTGDFAPGQIPGETWNARRVDDALLDLTAGPLATIVATPELPAGNYFLASRANIVGGAAASTVLCSMASDAAQNFTVAASGVFPLSMSGTATLTEPSTIELKCNKSAGTPRVAQANVIAIRVGELTRTPPTE